MRTAAVGVGLALLVALVTAHVQGMGAHDEHAEQHVWTAITLSVMSGMAATLGGLIVVLGGAPSKPVLGHLLSFSAGVMLYISYADLLAHSAGSDSTMAAVWMLVGMLGFWVVGCMVPEPELPVAAVAADKMTVAQARAALAARELSTEGKRDALVARLEAAGHKGGDAAAAASSSRMMMTGLVACVAISLHNLPEGLIVYTQTLSGVCTEPWGGWASEELARYARGCVGRGVAISVAMALHNIPEGMAVAAPVLSATGSRWEAIKWCVLSSVVEPAGAIILGLVFQGSLTPEVQAVLEAVVSGIMVMLCIMELMPTAAELAGPRMAALSNLAGQATIFAGLWLVHA